MIHRVDLSRRKVYVDADFWDCVEPFISKIPREIGYIGVSTMFDIQLIDLCGVLSINLTLVNYLVCRLVIHLSWLLKYRSRGFKIAKHHTPVAHGEGRGVGSAEAQVP